MYFIRCRDLKIRMWKSIIRPCFVLICNFFPTVNISYSIRVRDFCSCSTLWRVQPPAQFVCSLCSYLCSRQHMSRYLSWRDGRPRNRDSIIGKGRRFFFPSYRSVLCLLCCLSSGWGGSYFLWAKCHGLEAIHLPAPSAEFKNPRGCTSTPHISPC